MLQENNIYVMGTDVLRGRPLDSTAVGMYGNWQRTNRTSRGLTGEQLCFLVEELGGKLNQGQVSGYELGIKNPNKETVKWIAKAFAGRNASPEKIKSITREGLLAAFLGEEYEIERIPEDETHLLEAYRGLSPVEKQISVRYVETLRLSDIIGESEPVNSDMSDEELESGGKDNAMLRLREKQFSKRN
jgi:transcriptional regulator with XRE-family HTH domain